MKGGWQDGNQAFNADDGKSWLSGEMGSGGSQSINERAAAFSASRFVGFQRHL